MLRLSSDHDLATFAGFVVSEAPAEAGLAGLLSSSFL